MFVLAEVLALIAAMIIDKVLLGAQDVGLVYALVFIGLLVPGIAVAFRRMHDIDKSAWWLLLGLIPVVSLVLLYFFVQPGTVGPNRFGPDPKQTSGDVATVFS